MRWNKGFWRLKTHFMADGEGGGGDGDGGDAAAVAAAIGGDAGGGDSGGDGGDASAVAAAVGGDTGDASAWAWSEGVEGQGEKPEWFKSDKYKTVDEQAKAYGELETKFGAFTGAPEEYTVELSDELKETGLDIAADDPLVTEAMKFAKESGMNQEGFNGLVNLYAMEKAGELQALEDHKASELKGLGNNAQNRIDNLNKWANANMDAEMVEGFQEMATSTAGVKALERLVAMSRSAPVTPGDTTPSNGNLIAEVKAMQFAKDDHGNRKINTDPAFKAEYMRKRNEAFGTEDNHIVIGG